MDVHGAEPRQVDKVLPENVPVGHDDGEIGLERAHLR